MVEPASCGAGRHPRDGAGEPLSRGVHPGIAAGRPSRPGGGIAAVSAHPDSIRARRCRFVLFWRPVACKRGGGGIFEQVFEPYSKHRLRIARINHTSRNSSNTICLWLTAFDCSLVFDSATKILSWKSF